MINHIVQNSYSSSVVYCKYCEDNALMLTKPSKLRIERQSAALLSVSHDVTDVTTHISPIYMGMYAIWIIKGPITSYIYFLEPNYPGYFFRPDQTKSDQTTPDWPRDQPYHPDHPDHPKHPYHPDQPDHFDWSKDECIIRIECFVLLSQNLKTLRHRLLLDIRNGRTNWYFQN